MPASLEDFDAYVEANLAAEDDLPRAFAQWLANISGKPIVGEPVGQGRW